MEKLALGMSVICLMFIAFVFLINYSLSLWSDLGNPEKRDLTRNLRRGLARVLAKKKNIRFK